MLLPACDPPDVTPAPPPGQVAPAPPLTLVRLPPARLSGPDFRWSGEFRGLVTAAVEAGLYDLPGVLPSVRPDLPSPGDPLADLALRFADGALSVSGPPDALSLSLSLCVSGAACEEIAAPPCRREDPWPAVAALLLGAAAALAADVPPDRADAWSQRGSADTYAELLTGRAAAMWYGILPLPSPLPTGKLHPAFRAVLVDPKQPLAQWTHARWELGATPDGGQARAALSRAAVLRPHGLAWSADLARAQELTGRPREAADTLANLLRASPRDPRFVTAYARALLAADSPRDALAALDLLPPSFRWSPRVAALQVQIHQAAAAARSGSAGRTPDLDPLLAHWQATDSANPEPVRQRLAARTSRQDWQGALQLLPALRRRAPGPPTDALEAALLLALDDPGAARPLLPEPDQRRLDLARSYQADPGADLPPDPQDRAASLAAAEAALYRRDPSAALQLLASDDSADAWIARARALEQSGQLDQAAAAYQAAWLRDPGLPGGPVESNRIR